MNDHLFTGISGESIQNFLNYKRSIGYRYDGSIVYQLVDINILVNRFYDEHSISRMELSKECVEFVLIQKEGFQKNTYASLLRQLGLFLNTFDIGAYIIPKKMIPRVKRIFNPYIFDHNEITEVIKAVDSYCQTNEKLKIAIKETLPYIIRLLYSCALRISEVLNLKIEDVNLKQGFLFIQNSKKNKSRYVPLSETMIINLQQYNEKTVFNNEYYFQWDDEFRITKETVYYHYKKIITTNFNSFFTSKKLCLHTLRHTGAVHMIEVMVDAGKNVNQDIYTLSCLLGHETIKETEIYIHLPYYKFNELSTIYKINELFPEVETYEK